ncbi:cell division protein PerM [Microbacterium natoriense]
MQRLLVALLAAFDAAIAAAVGLAVLLAPLTLLWTLAFGVAADWGALWPLTGTLWQFGHGVAIDISLPTEVLTSVGIAPDAATFTLSVTPLAFLVFTLLFAARSGARAARSGAWLLGPLVGSSAFAVIAAGIALTSRIDAAQTSLLLSIVLPTAVYLAGSLCGAVRVAWEDGDGGLLDRVHDEVDAWGDWGPVPASAVRGAAVAVVGVTAASALGVAIIVALRAGEVVALFEAARVDVLGGTVITLGHLAYLPTLIVWAAAWIAGPGFAVGTGTAVSPAGTQLGVVPGIPVFGLLPENSSMWMLIVVLLPIAAGAFAGWAVRSRLVWEGTPLAPAPRAVIALGIGVLTAAVAAIAATLASGSIGPGRLADAGPAVLPFSLVLGAEVLLGAAILLLSPRHRDEVAEERTDRWIAEMAASDLPLLDAGAGFVQGGDANDTAPLDDLPPRGSGL